jgi:hypothetical protein
VNVCFGGGYREPGPDPRYTPVMRTLLLALALAVTAPAAASGSLPFVADDYAGARDDARARNVPLVVDVWAPW